MREVFSSAADTELGALFYNGKEAYPIRMLEEMGHQQLPTVLVTNNLELPLTPSNKSAPKQWNDFIGSLTVRQGQLHVIWRPGKQNLANYFSKHHPASHHRAIRQHHLYEPRSPDRPASNNYYACLQELPSHSYTMLLPFLA